MKTPLIKSIQFTHALTSKAKNWQMYNQLDLEEILKVLKNTKWAFNFHEFLSKEHQRE
jgi:hypothetical protein